MMIGTGTERRIIDSLLTAPEISRNESELIALAGTGKGAGAECLANFEKAGIVTITRVGRTKRITLNKENQSTFLLKQLRDEERKKLIQQERLAALLLFTKLSKNVVKLIIAFGSTIARTTRKDSDIDILIIGTDFEAISTARTTAENTYGFRFNLHEETEDGIRTKMDNESFIAGIVLKGIVFHGNDIARELYRKQSKTLKTLPLQERLDAAIRNYDHGDKETGTAIAEELLTKELFFIAEKNGSLIQGKKDAQQHALTTLLGKHWQKAKTKKGRSQLLALKELTKELITEELFHYEGYS